MSNSKTPEFFNRISGGHLPAHLGIVVTEVREGALTAELEVLPFLLAPNGFLHGGSVASLADTCAGYGAIAWDRGTGKYGASWNQPTPKRADEVALSECGASSCKIVQKVVPRMCGALATTEDGKHAGAARRKDREAARLAALANCQKDKAGECTVRATDCNK